MVDLEPSAWEKFLFFKPRCACCLFLFVAFFLSALCGVWRPGSLAPAESLCSHGGRGLWGVAAELARGPNRPGPPSPPSLHRREVRAGRGVAGGGAGEQPT